MWSRKGGARILITSNVDLNRFLEIWVRLFICSLCVTLNFHPIIFYLLIFAYSYLHPDSNTDYNYNILVFNICFSASLCVWFNFSNQTTWFWLIQSVVLLNLFLINTQIFDNMCCPLHGWIKFYMWKYLEHIFQIIIFYYEYPNPLIV